MRQEFILLLVLSLAFAAGAGPAVAGSAGTGSGTASATSLAECRYPVTVTDATGTEVTVEAAPERVVVTGASGAQTMWELDATEQVVGMPVQPWTAYLEGAENKTDVTNDDGTLNVEKTIGAEPDLVLAANITDNGKIAQLRDAGIAVYKFRLADSISSIYEKTNLTGRLTGNCGVAADVVSQMRDRVAAAEERVAGEERPDVFFSLGDGYTVTEGSFIHDVIVTAGGDNIATDLNASAYGKISQESVVEADPDFIVVTYSGSEPPENPASGLSGVYNNTTAVREGQVIAVNANLISQPAPRVVDPLTELSRAFAAWSAQQATTTTTATTTAETTTATTTTETTAAAGGETTATTDGNETATTTSSAPVPGFGIAAALLALLSAGLLVRRR
jgi:iron complex transport system substrate-binding protein